MHGLFAVNDSMSAAGDNAASVALFEGVELKGDRFIEAAN
jgi:hypothetical protein